MRCEEEMSEKEKNKLKKDIEKWDKYWEKGDKYLKEKKEKGLDEDSLPTTQEILERLEIATLRAERARKRARAIRQMIEEERSTLRYDAETKEMLGIEAKEEEEEEEEKEEEEEEEEEEERPLKNLKKAWLKFIKYEYVKGEPLREIANLLQKYTEKEEKFDVLRENIKISSKRKTFDRLRKIFLKADTDEQFHHFKTVIKLSKNTKAISDVRETIARNITKAALRKWSENTFKAVTGLGKDYKTLKSFVDNIEEFDKAELFQNLIKRDDFDLIKKFNDLLEKLSLKRAKSLPRTLTNASNDEAFHEELKNFVPA